MGIIAFIVLLVFLWGTNKLADMTTSDVLGNAILAAQAVISVPWALWAVWLLTVQFFGTHH
ncbi:hypothetical protein GCM10027285_10900 [Oleiagrimonas citrea]|uniref:Uncharacterized protein n=1 Tax=Oleiagrimonas citrea TaxID=1665687 RepID=A0A846ZL76_9GAMM|nr:hypothetical protein [Oleiagrimonas citrea]NKZ38349.1 hypothetical protein [Oleiagrimonas citrea]